ncbi:hypothetical protein B0O80DRAFT_471829 [Mortierella sp. GBAus27b]|nr:hypothetical protein B0O80DRAFT_471829 [Mortierella sp. GBAus27b]
MFLNVPDSGSCPPRLCISPLPPHSQCHRPSPPLFPLATQLGPLEPDQQSLQLDQS